MWRAVETREYQDGTKVDAMIYFAYQSTAEEYKSMAIKKFIRCSNGQDYVVSDININEAQ